MGRQAAKEWVGQTKPIFSYFRVMGILNVTPDSFYDGGKHARLDRAVRRAEKMAEEGADILDVGGESSRPGAESVSAREECARVVPVVRALAARFPKIPVSVDTAKAEVARRALAEGARMVNDISALADPRMAGVLLEYRPWVVLMHMKGRPKTMQKQARYKNVVREVKHFLSARVRRAAALGLDRKKIILDPGIGFGKTVEHNLQILRGLKSFLSLGCPVLVGCSRKSFIGAVLGGEGAVSRGDRSAQGGTPLPPEERLEGSLVCAAWAYLQGASILRVHDVGPTRKALLMADALAAA